MAGHAVAMLRQVPSSDEPGQPAGSPPADDVEYEFHVERVIRGREASTRAAWESSGWEFMSLGEGLLRREMTFRRVKPEPRLTKAQQLLLIKVGGGFFAVVLVVAIVVGILSERDTAEPTAAPAEPTSSAPSESPTEEPSEEPTPEPTKEPTRKPPPPAPKGPVTDGEVVHAFRSYLDERAAAGVVIAQAATDVSYRDRVVRVTFDPAAVGMDRATFDRINPYNNPFDASESLADFVSTVIAFNDDVGIRLRPAIDRIETVYADGTPLGTRTMAEIIKLNGLGR
jgi:hypothetical protein